MIKKLILRKQIFYLFALVFISLIKIVYGKNISNESISLEDGSGSVYFENDILAPWEGGPSYYSQWANGPSSSSDFFPIAVWLQNPSSANATVYKNIGINTYIGLYHGPTESQLEGVANRSLTTFCEQNSVGLNSSNNDVIKAWIHIDEPDNAVSGTSTPISTATIIDHYNEIKNSDGTRPVYLNFGHGVGSDAWYGRGDRTNHPEDYAEYSKGGDILSFDIYPMNIFPSPDSDPSWKKAFRNTVAQNPWYVANGVKRLREWTNFSKPVWTWIECTNMHGNDSYMLTPSIVKAEVWMALINGARGVGYFCHQFDPFIEAGLLANTEMTNSVLAVNEQIHSLAEVLNTQSVSNGFSVVSSNEEVSIDAMLKRIEGYTYLFAVSVHPGTTEATFTLNNFSGNTTIEVVGEDRSLNFTDGVFEDTFTDYGVHIYKVDHSITSVSAVDLNPFDYKLISNFPNPFSDQTTIRYQMPHAGLVQMEVFDIYGKKVTILINEEKHAGKYEVIFNAGGLKCGVYICKLRIVSNQGKTEFLTYQKMILH